MVKDLDDSTSSSQTSLLGIEFLFQFFGNDGDGRVGESDYLLVTCSEPLRPDSEFGAVVKERIGTFSSVSAAHELVVLTGHPPEG